MKIEMTSKDGVTLLTAGKYCTENIEVVPAFDTGGGAEVINGDEIITLEGQYDGTPITGVESVDLASYIEQKKLPLSISISGERSLKKFIDFKQSAASLFSGTKNITNINGILEYEDTSNAKSTNSMFYDCESLTEVPLFDTSNVTNMSSMFGSYPMSGNYTSNTVKIETVPLFNTSKVTTMSSMFANCINLKTVPLFDTRNVTNMSSMFSCCRNLTEVPLFDTSNVTNMSNMFNQGGYSNSVPITEVPLFNTSKVTNMEAMFRGCYKLTTIPLFDTSNVTNMSSMLASCSALTEIPHFNTENVTTFSYFLQYCKITEIPLFNTTKATGVYGMFQYCSQLEKIPALDLRKVTGADNFVQSCAKLSECMVKNIAKTNLQVGSGTSYGHLLTMDSLLNLLNETVYTTTSRKLTVGSANLAKFTGDYEYVKKTGVYLDLDDNEVDTLTAGTTKIPVVWCSSTDEGAMLVANYMLEKGWTIA